MSPPHMYESIQKINFHNETNKTRRQSQPPLIPLWSRASIAEDRSSPLQASATGDLMTAEIIGFTRAEASEEGHLRGQSVTLAVLIPPPKPQHISTYFLALNLIMTHSVQR